MLLNGQTRDVFMSAEKITAMQELIAVPSNYNKLVLYEEKLRDAILSLFFDCRNITIRSVDSSKFVDEVARIVPQIKTRVDSLIDRARMHDMRIRPGTPEKTSKLIMQNAVIYDFIMFSRTWDLKKDLGDFDSQIVFGEVAKLKTVVSGILENIQTISELFVSKEQAKNDVQSTENVTATLAVKFNEELAFAQKAGALKGIVKLDKPLLLGRDKFYTQLGNIILKIAMTFGDDELTKPIALRAIYSRLNDEFPRVKASMKDVLKAVEELDTNGLVNANQDHEGMYWIQMYSSDSAENIILQMAQEKGFVTLEEVVMHTNWSIDKAKDELNKFVSAGSAIVDASYSTGTKSYFPGLADE
ncbi:MAG: hypothetical protein ACTSPT_09915 [Candidatus Heimdallarchaeota archaeon]